MIEWQQQSSRSQITIAWSVPVAGEFQLVAIDKSGGQFGPAKVVWGILGPPDHLVVLERGVAANLDAAKRAAERAFATITDLN
jgi:hypothetical protein